MIEHVWTIFCQQAIIDKKSNNLSIINALEELVVHGQPVSDGVIQGPFELVNLWIRGKPSIPEKGIIRYSFRQPSGDTKILTEIGIDLSSHEHHRQILNINGIHAPEEGRYYFIIEVKDTIKNEWIIAASVPLNVTFETPKGS